MLSTRGAISTSVAMVECASGQNMANRDVFLLSELEKVWVTHAVLARRLLLDTQPSSSSNSTAASTAATAAAKTVTAVQIPHFGSFWTEPQLLHVDVHRRRYTTRRLCFGLCRHFATRYGVDTSKVPLEPQYCHHAHSSRLLPQPQPPPQQQQHGSAATCRAIHTAEVVELCGVPAHTAQAALREFVLYVGEGLYRGRVFALALPGVATLVMKREKVMLTPDAELLRDMYALDARRWPVAVRETCDGAHAEQMMLWQQQQQQPSSLSASSRPVSSSSSSRPVSSRVSWRSNGRTASTTAAAATRAATADAPPRPTFVTACPAGRLFSDIAKEQQQRRYATAVAQAQGVEQTTNAAQWQQEQPLQRWHAMEQRVQQQQHACYDHDDDDEGSERDDDAAPCSGESVYKLVADACVGDDDDDADDDDDHTHSMTRAQAAAAASSSSAQHVGEPEVESCEVVADGGVTRTHAPPHSHPHTLPRPMGGKDAQLEAVLRREERFSRPISRQTFHEQCSAQQLIYGEHSTTTTTATATLQTTTRAGREHRDAAAGVRLRHAL